MIAECWCRFDWLLLGCVKKPFHELLLGKMKKDRPVHIKCICHALKNLLTSFCVFVQMLQFAIDIYIYIPFFLLWQYRVLSFTSSYIAVIHCAHRKIDKMHEKFSCCIIPCQSKYEYFRLSFRSVCQTGKRTITTTTKYLIVEAGRIRRGTLEQKKPIKFVSHFLPSFQLSVFLPHFSYILFLFWGLFTNNEPNWCTVAFEPLCFRSTHTELQYDPQS